MPKEVPGKADVSRVVAGSYTLEPKHTQVRFTVMHMGFTPFTGSFSDASGTLDLDPADGEGISWLHRHAEVLDKALRDDGRYAVTVRVDPAKAERVRNRFGLTKPIDGDAL